MRQTTYSHRLFEIFDQDFNNNVPMKRFLATVWDILVFDRDNTEQLAFRLFSRRGTTFSVEVTVLDQEDFKLWVGQRYKSMKQKEVSPQDASRALPPPHAAVGDEAEPPLSPLPPPSSQVNKTSRALFRHIDIDCSGGITFQEFSEFCRSTPVFLMYAHGFQAAVMSGDEAEPPLSQSRAASRRRCARALHGRVSPRRARKPRSQARGARRLSGM